MYDVAALRYHPAQVRAEVYELHEPTRGGASCSKVWVVSRKEEKILAPKVQVVSRNDEKTVRLAMQERTAQESNPVAVVRFAMGHGQSITRAGDIRILCRTGSAKKK